MGPKGAKPAPVPIRVRLSSEERRAVKASARRSGRTLSDLLRRAAEQGYAAECGRAELGAQERGDLDDLVARLRAAGLVLNSEVRAAQARAAGYPARPDYRRAQEALLDLLGGMRRAVQMLRGRRLAGRPVALGVVVSADLTGAQALRAAEEARKAGLPVRSYLRLALLRCAGVAARRDLVAEDAARHKRLAAQIAGALGNAARFQKQPLRGLVAAEGASGLALQRAVDDCVREGRALLRGDGGADRAPSAVP